MGEPSPNAIGQREKMKREGANAEKKWQAKVSSRRATKLSKDGEHGDYTVLYLPGLEKMALGLAEELGDSLPVLCTDELATVQNHEEMGMAWERFPSGDPDLKLRVDFIKDRHVVLLMNHDTVHLFEQLAVILFLQRFNVPHALDEYAKGKWKRTMADGKYDVCSVASLTIIVPWYRHCQMERTSRWTVAEGGKWYNGKPAGEFVDVPTAQSFAAMLSALPIPGTLTLPPQRLLLLDIHEYEDLEVTLNSTKRWANELKAYDPVHGVGTYFASPFDRFLSTVMQPLLASSGVEVVAPLASSPPRLLTALPPHRFASSPLCLVAASPPRLVGHLTFSSALALPAEQGVRRLPRRRRAPAVLHDGAHVPAWHSLCQHPLD